MERRTFLALSAAAASAQSAPVRSQLGVAYTSYLSYRRPRDTYEFLEHCHGLGAAGIQIILSSTDPAYVKKFRARAEELGMYFEAFVTMLDKDSADITAQVRAAREAGATGVRTACLGGRRYETFKTLEDWKSFVARSEKSMEVAARVAEAERMPMGMENHKDWTLDDLTRYMRRYGNEYFGLCLDTGNNIALLDDPDELVEAMIPYTKTTHLKDMAWANYEDGLLLSEVNLGEGFLKVSDYIAKLRKANPKVKLSLEMITRDPLKVPYRKEAYFLTMPEVRARMIARLSERIPANAKPLPYTSKLGRTEQLQLEDDNVRACLRTYPA